MRSEWETFAIRIGANADVYHQLDKGYSDESRHYHGWSHICKMLDEYRSQSLRDDALELAIWFHDAVYDVLRKDNERKSAELVDRLCGELETPLLKRAVSLVLLTEHRRKPIDALEGFMLDLDLLVLGASRECYNNYAKAIRSEYSVFGDEEYAEGRIAVLREFLERERIYWTKSFEGSEASARENIEWEIAEWEGFNGISIEDWEATSNWDELSKKGESIAAQCIARLPEPLKLKAKNVPCLIRRWHPSVDEGDEEGRELLGEYLSEDDEGLSEAHGVILLYVGAIALYCEEEHLDF